MPHRSNPNTWKGKRSMLAWDALNRKMYDPRFIAESSAAQMRAERAGVLPGENLHSLSSSDEPLSHKRRTAGPSFSNASDYRETPITPVSASSGSVSHACDEVAALKQEIKKLNEEYERRVTELQRANQRLVHENAALRAGHGADVSMSTTTPRLSMMLGILKGNMEDGNLGERQASDAEVAKFRRELHRELYIRLSPMVQRLKSAARR